MRLFPIALAALLLSPACASVKDSARTADKESAVLGKRIKKRTHSGEQRASKTAKKEVKGLQDDIKEAARRLKKKLEEADKSLQELSD